MTRRLLIAVAIVLACAAAARSVQPAAASSAPPIRHVFVIVLENKDAAKTFAADSPAPYLAHELPRAGVYVPDYYGIGHVSLDNYVAMVSGQAPNPQTQSDCQFYTEFAPGTIGPDGQALGTGCVYPASVKTIADQLAAKGLTWKGYMQDMGDDPARDGGTTCAHPQLNTRDASQTASAADQYAARHNPFVYFHSLTDTSACAANDVPLARLVGDLERPETTANLSFITPDLCHDAHDATCADGGAGGLPAADAFLREWVPRITSAPAFHDGLLIVTFDEAESDSTACCAEPTGPNTPDPGGAEPGPGGGKIGAVMLSPYIAAATRSTRAYNHYALLRSVEDLFGLDHLGYAAQDGLEPFGADVYTNPAGTTPPPPAPGGQPSGGPRPPRTTPCRGVSLAGRPRHLRHGTLLADLHIVRAHRRRLVTFRARRAARVLVDSGGRRKHVRVHACRRYRVALRGRRGAVRVVALSGHHSERRRLRT